MKPRSWLRVVLAVAAVLLGGLAAWGFWPSSELRDLVYAAPDGTPLTLDLDFPASSPPPYALVLFAPPDGEWPRELKWEARCRSLIEAFTGHGYAVATIHYRPPGKYHFPAQIEDGKEAVRWLRANADHYHLDARRMGVVGVSQGGWGVCMLGTTSPENGFEGTGNTEQSSRVQAVVGLGVPGDLGVQNLTDRVESRYLYPLLGARYAENPGLYERASPGAYASADDPPFLLFHSRDDLVVPVEMARTFADRLRQAGVPVTLVEEDGIDHVWGGPKLARAIEQSLRFFDQHLRPGER